MKDEGIGRQNPCRFPFSVLREAKKAGLYGLQNCWLIPTAAGGGPRPARAKRQHFQEGGQQPPPSFRCRHHSFSPRWSQGASTKGSQVTFPALRPDLYWVARRNGWEQLLPSALAGINSYGWFDHPRRIAILPALFIESRPSRRRVSSRPHDLTRWPGLTLRLGHTHAHVQSRG